jgi:tRNA threonylcarbamoyl adenosine modification protein (Sua5/YciO/YrdC/YwlC family)
LGRKSVINPRRIDSIKFYFNLSISINLFQYLFLFTYFYLALVISQSSYHFINFLNILIIQHTEGVEMIVINFDEYNLNRKTILKEVQNSVFVYPTDTIYGIGCSALNEKLVNKIRKLKQSSQPFSVIVPNKEWIYENCTVTEEWIRKLPGPYTLLLKLKNKKAVAKNVHNYDLNGDVILGVRMPNHWFLAISYSLKLPIVTTSANVTSQNFMTSLEDLDSTIRNGVDYVFYEGPKKGNPSTIVHLAGEKAKVLPRTAPKSSHKNIAFPLEEINISRK